MDIVELMNICECEKLKGLETLTVNHITPREYIDSVWQEGLMMLPHTLIKRTVLSEYLSELGFEFTFDEKHIVMKKNGEIVDIDSLNFSNLRMRLGGKKTLNDFNVNGYLFVNEFKVDAVRGWLGSPEILKSLATAYKQKSIADDYASKTNNYYVSFEVPIDKVDIEGFPDSLGDDRKTEILLKYAIMALAYQSIIRDHTYLCTIQLRC